jgi:hypothetical protein
VLATVKLNVDIRHAAEQGEAQLVSTIDTCVAGHVD